MQQVLFWIPIKTAWFPDGIPVYAYGAMLFVTFVACVLFATYRSKLTGIDVPRERYQDLGITVFVLGLAGARIVYMIQFGVPWFKFFRIWEGGIVLYGGIIGGALGFILFHRYVLRKMNISLWLMADLAAPSLAIGIALGRVGCLLNGCCWGNVAGEGCPSISFPLLTCPSREMLVDRDGVQTVDGFLSKRNAADLDDVRTVVGKVEPDSAAARAGLKEGDEIVRINVNGDWKPNGQVLAFEADPASAKRVAEGLKGTDSTIEPDPAGATEAQFYKVTTANPEQFGPTYRVVQALLARERGVVRLDGFQDLLNNWPRGRNTVQFAVEREGKEIELPAFTPRGLGLHPTQVYETISMLLLLVLLLAFYPFRRHDGQVWVLFMAAYAVHRFLNEILRTEPVEGLNMTLSQNISVLMLLAALGLEIYLRKTQPKRGPVATPDPATA
jgi:phosphatidylglycerol:prolipoprotein diacylglycerol transferase